MPEGDTIYRAARTLHRALEGREVTRFDTVFPHLDRVHDDTPITGRVFERIYPHGKHLLMRLSGDLELRTHMRMSGSWHIYRPGEPWQKAARHMRIRLDTDAFVAVAFNVHEAEFVRSDAPLRRRRGASAVGRLGPDLLAETFDDAAMAEGLKRLRAMPGVEVGIALLDQSNVAGVGNQYRSELLFLAGVHPRRSVGSLSDEDLSGLLRDGRRLALHNTRGDGPRRTTGADDPDRRLWVYGRADRPCRRCGMAIERGRSGIEARVVFWCPSCQPET